MNEVVITDHKKETSVYSHAFFVGSLNSEGLSEEALVIAGWRRASEDYGKLCSIYYKSHVDAMMDTGEESSKPSALRCIRHYVCGGLLDSEGKAVENNVGLVDVGGKAVENDSTDVWGKTVENYRQLRLDNYVFRLCNLHLYIYPLNIVLFSVEADDSGNTMEDLSYGHLRLSQWRWDGFSEELKEVLSEYFAPLSTFLPDQDLSRLTERGGRLKIYQVIKTELSEVDDALLYELGTCTPIGSVLTPQRVSPSKQYFDEIMRDNSVYPYRNWKGLALNDTFTCLGTSDFDEREWVNEFFPLIFLRVFLEKTFSHSRNIAFREDVEKGSLLRELMVMDQYYFYSNISYKFLPNMLYSAMLRGMDVATERDELSEQLKYDNDRKMVYVVALISAIALFSAAADLYDMVKLILLGDSDSRILASVIFLIGLCALLYLLHRISPDLMLRFRRFWGKGRG